MTYKTFLPVIMQGQPYSILPLGCQIEGHIGDRVQWVVPNRQYQFGIKWRDVETVKGTYNWSAYDPDFLALTGQKITIGVKVVPVWARLWSGYVASPPKASNYIDLANFIKALIARYGVDAVELFNEPDVDRDGAKWAEEYFGAWCINSDWYTGGRLYGGCLNAIYPIIHATYPNVRIIAGALIGADPSSLQFLQGSIDNGLKCDAISFHKYIGLGGNFNAAFEFGVLIRNKSSLSQILSETSITSSTDSDELKQAQENYLIHLRQGYINSTIDVIQWYSLANNFWMNTDLVRNSIPTSAYNVWIT